MLGEAPSFKLSYIPCDFVDRCSLINRTVLIDKEMRTRPPIWY